MQRVLARTCMCSWRLYRWDQRVSRTAQAEPVRKGPAVTLLRIFVLRGLQGADGGGGLAGRGAAGVWQGLRGDRPGRHACPASGEPVPCSMHVRMPARASWLTAWKLGVLGVPKMGMHAV